MNAAGHFETPAELEKVFRQEQGRILAALIGWLGDFDLAEEALQDAFVAALEHWSSHGRPQNPGAWLTTAARRKAIDRLRRERADTVDPEQLDQLPAAPSADETDEIPDERLKLMFTCCHPALPIDQQVALTLHTLGGLSTGEIAAAFLTPVPTLAQRLVRAKKKIKAAGIPYTVPAAHLLAERLDAVLAVIYLIFTEGYAATSGPVLVRGDLCEEAIRLCRVLERLVRPSDDVSPERAIAPPAQYAEVLGLLALMLLHHSRRQARLRPQGELALLDEQDRSLWDRQAIAAGLALLDKALYLRRPGPYQIQAAISALHSQAQRPEDTDWPQIAALYAELLRRQDTPVVRLNAAVAVAMADSPQAGLDRLRPLAGELDGFAPFHTARADMLRRLGQVQAAERAYRQALDLTQNQVERRFILKRLAKLAEGDES